jgi:hypothetical protein
MIEQIEHLSGLIGIWTDVAAWEIGRVGECVWCYF